MKTYVYIDGFNLYYGALKKTAFRWLDPKALTKTLIPAKYQIELIRYFTARVSGIPDPDAPRRQAVYLSAIKSIPEVRLHFGNFLSKTIWRPLANVPVANKQILCPNPIVLPVGNHTIQDQPRSQILPVGSYPPPGAIKPRKTPPAIANAVMAEVHTKEEKGSDVNLAAYLLDDAWKERYEAAVVISNDTDLVTPIRMVTKERGKEVFIVCPGRWSVSPKLANAATYTRHVRPGMLRSSQLPNPIPGTTIRKPRTW